MSIKPVKILLYNTFQLFRSGKYFLGVWHNVQPFILLLERVGLIIIIAYLLMNTSHFKTMMGEREKWRSQWQLLIIFGLFAITSNFTGIEIKDGQIISSNIYYHLNSEASMANTRVLTIGASGLIGGPYVALL